jgi:hypothetical protein
MAVGMHSTIQSNQGVWENLGASDPQRKNKISKIKRRKEEKKKK